MLELPLLIRWSKMSTRLPTRSQTTKWLQLMNPSFSSTLWNPTFCPSPWVSLSSMSQSKVQTAKKELWKHQKKFKWKLSDSLRSLGLWHLGHVNWEYYLGILSPCLVLKSTPLELRHWHEALILEIVAAYLFFFWFE